MTILPAMTVFTKGIVVTVLIVGKVLRVVKEVTLFLFATVVTGVTTNLVVVVALVTAMILVTIVTELQ